MTKDFARKNRSEPAPPAGPPRLALFAAGMITGAFITALAFLWYLSPSTADPDSTALSPRADPDAQANQPAEEMKWDFYEIFPRSEVPVVEEYDTGGALVRTDQYRWILQVGSFRDPVDADELRASLLLQGLTVSTTTVEVDDVKWHRVIVGPFDTELERNRAQDRLAQAEVKAIPMRIPR